MYDISSFVSITPRFFSDFFYLFLMISLEFMNIQIRLLL